MYEQAFKNVIGLEGDETNDPRDPGGHTKFGISKRANPDLDIGALTVEDAQRLYRVRYWDKIKGDDIAKHSPALAEYLFDYAVNSGVHTAAAALQKAVGALPDGRIGPQTLASVPKYPPRHIARLVFVARCKTFAEASAYETYKNGWFGRLFDVTERLFGAL